jgi:hypothetical protein
MTGKLCHEPDLDAFRLQPRYEDMTCGVRSHVWQTEVAQRWLPVSIPEVGVDRGAAAISPPSPTSLALQRFNQVASTDK